MVPFTTDDANSSERHRDTFHSGNNDYWRGALHAVSVCFLAALVLFAENYRPDTSRGVSEAGVMRVRIPEERQQTPALQNGPTPVSVPAALVHEPVLLEQTKALQVWKVPSRTNHGPPRRGDDVVAEDLQVYVNGRLSVMSSDEAHLFFESWIHPAFMASSQPVRRVLLLLGGGGATATGGGALRQILRYAAVEHVDAVIVPDDDEEDDDDDDAVMRRHLPSLFDCTGFGTSDCFEDPRVTVHRTGDALEWLKTSFGEDALYCRDEDSRSSQVEEDLQDKKYDIVFFDAGYAQGKGKDDDVDGSDSEYSDSDDSDDSDSDSEHSGSQDSKDSESQDSDSQDSEDADSQDSEDSESQDSEDSDSEDYGEEDEYYGLVKRLPCALSRFGVLSASMGQAPEPGFASSIRRQQAQSRQEGLQGVWQEYNHRSKLIENTLKWWYWHRRVYEVPLIKTNRLWTVAVGMVPYYNSRHHDVELQRAVFDGRANGGANDFDDRPAKINLRLRRELQPGIKLDHYDGVTQHFFQHSLGDWHGVFCLDSQNDRICKLSDLFTTDHEQETLELKLEADHNGHSGTYAKVDIPKGTVTGIWDAASDLNMPNIQFFRAKYMADGFETQYNDFPPWVYTYGFDGGRSGLGERIQVSINSYHNFLNHACDHKPNLANVGHVAPWIKEVWDKWNPVLVRIAGELDHFKIAVQDIKKGELVLDDYAKWDGFLQSTTGLQDFSRLERWCKDGRRVMLRHLQGQEPGKTNTTTNLRLGVPV